MLTSLFGDLQPRRGALRSDRDNAAGFANTTVFEDAAQGFAATQVMDELRPARVRPQPVVEDVFVSGSPAAAMRAHFAGTPLRPGTRFFHDHAAGPVAPVGPGGGEDPV